VATHKAIKLNTVTEFEEASSMAAVELPLRPRGLHQGVTKLDLHHHNLSLSIIFLAFAACERFVTAVAGVHREVAESLERHEG
jgi:hypothetical protein